jgi:hypothetical protein
MMCARLTMTADLSSSEASSSVITK